MITVLFQTESHYPVNRKKIKQAIIDALAPQVHRDAEVGVTIVGDRRMKQLNGDFRNIDKTTDVLSFGLNDPMTKSVPFAAVPDDVLRLGDIVISYPQAIKEAAEENQLVDDKIIELALHGLDHLMGIHHPE
ncbi:rRNA maturation RNase YbeY [Candidatus Gottesmanbacteria bacterium]|nr:rRNA maturation RNase YbeY [Candidatus Gottesmanbacteria bacterium]